MIQERFVGMVVGFTTVAVTLLVLGQFERDATSEPLQHSEYDKRLDRLDRKGIEAAYANRVALLFQNWMTDTTRESSDRALRGHRNARKIYIEAMTNLDARDPEEGIKLQSDTSSAPFILPPRESK